MSVKTEVKVSFRAEKSGAYKGELTAVFSGDLDTHTGELLCYAHNGQHSHCSREWYRSTRPATDDEYADLLRELESIGYAVTVVSRVSWDCRTLPIGSNT